MHDLWLTNARIPWKGSCRNDYDAADDDGDDDDDDDDDCDDMLDGHFLCGGSNDAVIAKLTSEFSTQLKSAHIDTGILNSGATFADYISGRV